jgi:AraC-like DNA-binding protein
MMRSLFTAAATLTVSEAEATVDAIILVARASLNAAFARAGSQPDRSSDDLMARALTFIERNLADPLLSAERIQAYLALSRSRLYRLFEPEGGVRAVILRQRLNACLRLLLTGQVTNQPWWKLAVDHGFSSETQLARAFSRRFGVTPRNFHDMISRKDHEGLTAQAQRAGFVTLQAWLDHLAGRGDADADKPVE